MFKNILNSGKDKLTDSWDQTHERITSFVNKNADLFKNSVEENNLSEFFADVDTFRSSIDRVSPFFYELLPLPIKLIVSEKKFCSFVGDNAVLFFELVNTDNIND